MHNEVGTCAEILPTSHSTQSTLPTFIPFFNTARAAKVTLLCGGVLCNRSFPHITTDHGQMSQDTVILSSIFLYSVLNRLPKVYEAFTVYQFGLDSLFIFFTT